MLRLRQVALAVEALEPAAGQVVSALGVRECFRDPGVGEFGLENVLFPVGGDFLELVSPKEPNTAAGRYIARRGGDTGYMVLLQTDDALSWRRRLVAKGVRSVWAIDPPPAMATHFHPADTGGVLLSIDSDPRAADPLAPMAAWPWAGREWADGAGAGGLAGLAAVDLESPDPDAQAALWSKLLERPLAENAGHLSLELDRGRIRFLKGRGPVPGVAGITLWGKEPRAPFGLLGCRISVEAGPQASMNSGA